MNQDIINIITGQGQRAGFVETTKRLITGDPTARFNQLAWEEEATAAQLQIGTLLGNRDWDWIPSGEDQRPSLTMKVGYAIYGEPKLEKDVTNRKTGFSPKQLEHIDSICNQMTKGIDENEDIHCALLYIIVGFDNKITAAEHQKLKEEMEVLEKKIAGEIEEDEASNLLFDKMKNHINREKLREVQGRLKEDYSLPVFKCRSSTSSSYVVVDSWHVRSYASWKNFIAEENLPELCRFCAPEDGKYSNAKVTFHYPRANSKTLLDKMLTIAEWTGIVVSFVSPLAGLVIVSFAAGAKIIAAGCAIADRYEHGQNIRFDAIQHWLRIGFSCLKIVTVGLEVVHMTFGLDDVAENLFVIRGLRLALTCFDTQHVSMHVFGIANLIVELMKIARVRKLDTSDFLNLSLSCLTFANISITFKEQSTGQVIRQAQSDFLNFTRAALSRAGSELVEGSNVAQVYKHFKRMLTDQIHRIGDIVQACQNLEIENTMDLIRAISLNPKNLKVFGDIGKHFENGKLRIDKCQFHAPLKWLPVDESIRLDLYHSIERYNFSIAHAATKSNDSEANAIRRSAKRDHETDVMELGESFQFLFEDMHRSVMDTLCRKYSEIFGIKIKSADEVLVSGRPIFAKLTRHQMTRLGQVLHDTLDIDNRSDLLRLVHEFAEFMQCRVFRKYLKYAEFFAKTFFEKRTKILNGFRQQLLEGKTIAEVRAHIGILLGLGLEEIKGPFIKHADAVAVRQFEGVHRGKALRMENLAQAFTESRDNINSPVNVPEAAFKIGVLSSDLASYRYQRHKYFEYAGQRSRNFPEDLELIKSAFGRLVNPTKENVVRVQNSCGTCTIVTFKCDLYGIMAGVINKFYDEDDNKTSGIITIMSYSSLNFNPGV